MNVEIGAEAAQFPEREYINRIAVAVQDLAILTLVRGHCPAAWGSQWWTTWSCTGWTHSPTTGYLLWWEVTALVHEGANGEPHGVAQAELIHQHLNTYFGERSLPCCMREPMVNLMELHRLNSFTNIWILTLVRGHCPAAWGSQWWTTWSCTG